MTDIQKLCLNINCLWSLNINSSQILSYLLVSRKFLNELTSFDHLQKVRNCLLSQWA